MIAGFQTLGTNPLLIYHHLKDLPGYGATEGKSFPSVKCTHVNDPRFIDLEFSELDESLYMPNLKLNLKTSSYFQFGRKYGRIWNYYSKLIPASAAKKFLDCLVSIPKHICEACLIEHLKLISNNHLKCLISFGMTNCLFLLDLVTLCGFDTVLNRVDPIETIARDFGTPSSNTIDPVIFKNIDFYVNKLLIRKNICSFKEFVSMRDEWANPGSSSYGETAKVVINYRKTKSKKLSIRNKWFKTMDKSDDTIIKDALASDSTFVRPFRKSDEPAKTRMIQGYDTLSILRCTYLDYCFKSLNPAQAWTSTGFTPSQKVRMRTELLKNDGQTRICTDQSQFDISQPKEMVVYAIHSICSRILSFPQYSDVHSVIKAELNSMKKVILHLPDKNISWRKGLLSGHKWTSLLGSILNAASSKSVMDRLGVYQNYSLYQGDDCVIKTKDFVTSEQIAGLYQQFGFQINPSKTWINQYRCEYLHEIYDSTSSRVYAFPARIARAVIFEKPNVGQFSSNSDKLRSYLDTLLKGKRRGLIGMDEMAYRLMVKNYSTANRKLIAESIDTPMSLGGLGFGNRGNVSVSFKVKLKSAFSFTLNKRSALSLPSYLSEFEIKSRLAVTVPLPGFSKYLAFDRFKKTEIIPFNIREIAMHVPNIPYTWNVFHFSEGKDVYFKRILLNYKLRKNIPILSEDLPTRVFDHSKYSVDVSYRKFIRYIGYSINLDSFYTTSESYLSVKNRFQSIWNGLSYLLAIGSSKIETYGTLKQKFIASLKVDLHAQLPSVYVLV